MSNTFDITLLPLDGAAYVDITQEGGALGPGNASGTLPANLNDQILYTVFDSTGGTVVVNSDGDYTCNAGASFFYRIFDNDTKTWGEQQQENTPALSLAAENGTLTVTGEAALLEYHRVLNADPGSYAVTGITATLPVGRTFSAAPGAYTVTGQDAELIFTPITTITFNVDAGEYSVTGREVTLRLEEPGDYSIAADPYPFSITGSDTDLRRDLVLEAESGEYTVTGFIATLRLEQPGQFFIAADPNPFTVNGSEVSYRYDRAVTAETGTYTIDGQAVNFPFGNIILADPGEISVTGSDVFFGREIPYQVQPGDYAVQGSPASFIIDKPGFITLLAEAGRYNVTGSEADLVYVPAGSRLCRLMFARWDNRLMKAEKDDRLLFVPACKQEVA